MKLNKNSFSARLYRWFYCVNEYNMPNNLCPYAWKLFVMWITIIPYLIFSLFFQIKNKFRTEPIGFTMRSSVFVNLFVFLIFTIGTGLSSLFYDFEQESFLWFISYFGLMLFLSILILIFILLIDTLFSLAIENFKPRKNKSKKTRQYIVKEFIKAKYNNYCPKINWE